ncbi:MAG: type VI secretion system tube protein TssD [Byssovorax sp.]
MALSAYVSIVAEKQGQIRGSVTQKGREGKIMVVAVQHEIVCPRDPASGIPTGKRVHKPLMILKETDRSTPLLYNVLTHNENLKSVEIQFWQPSPTGAERQHWTIRLTNANISSIQFKLGNTRSPKLARYSELEEVSFTYQKIEWTWTEGGIMADDDWESPR